MPEYTPPCSAQPIEEARVLAEKWEAAKANSDDLSKFSSADIEGWGTTKLIVFLDFFLDTKEGAESRLSSAACEKMANLYNFLNSNCEIRVRFLRACLCA